MSFIITARDAKLIRDGYWPIRRRFVLRLGGREYACVARRYIHSLPEIGLLEGGLFADRTRSWRWCAATEDHNTTGATADSFANARRALRRLLLRGDEISKRAFLVPAEEYDGIEKLIDPTTVIDLSGK